jgi:hypothetical protein
MLPEKRDEAPQWLSRAISMFDKDSRKDGDMLSHDWIKYALDIPAAKTIDQATEQQWVLLTRLDAFRDYLLVERKVALQNIRGEGYRIVPPSEQAQVAAEQAMKMIKKGLDHGDRLMTHTRVNMLSNDEQKRHTDAHLRLCGIKDMVRRQKKDVFKLFQQQ